ncbi:MAG: DUF6754 domain-containing protein [Candidatus Eisenbacteria bacterium]
MTPVAPSSSRLRGRRRCRPPRHSIRSARAPAIVRVVAWLGLLLLHAAPAFAQASVPRTWYDPVRTGAPFVLFVVFSGSVIFFILRSRQGHDLFIRRIAGLTAIEEAVGRATELGKKVLYLPGSGTLDENQTIASLAVLSHVASLSARYGADLAVLNKDPLTYAASRETVQEAYLQAGRPDLFNDDVVSYVTYDQFAFTAAVTGYMVRERPAANFFIGYYQAESLLLAETGQTTGAIQIAGTAEVTQLPFFAVVCDYTLMGEELYAAGAYLSREPAMLGSIKGQDFTKAALIFYLIAGVVLEALGVHWLSDFMSIQ